jgi:hypothetical protein
MEGKSKKKIVIGLSISLALILIMFILSGAKSEDGEVDSKDDDKSEVCGGWVKEGDCTPVGQKYVRKDKDCPSDMYDITKFESCKYIGPWIDGGCDKDGIRYFSRQVANAPGEATKKVEDCCYMGEWRLDGKCSDEGMGNYIRTIGSKCDKKTTPTTKRDTCCKVFGWKPKGSCTDGKQIYTRVTKNCNDYQTSMVKDCCDIGQWVKSGECKSGAQIYVRSTKGYCPEKPKTTKIVPCCTPGNWVDSGKCDGEYEEQFRSVSKGCSDDVSKTRKVKTAFCKEQEDAGKLTQKKQLKDADKKRLQELMRARAKELAIKQQKARETAKSEELAARNVIERDIKNAQRKVQECANMSWNGVNLLSPDYKLYITKDNEVASSSVKHGQLKIDVTIGKTRISPRITSRSSKDYRTTKTVISMAKYIPGTRGRPVLSGYSQLKTYDGHLYISGGKLMLRKYLSRGPQPKRDIEIAKFQTPGKHAVVLVSFANKNNVLFIKDEAKRSYDLIAGKWIDHPYPKC